MSVSRTQNSTKYHAACMAAAQELWRHPTKDRSKITNWHPKSPVILQSGNNLQRGWYFSLWLLLTRAESMEPASNQTLPFAHAVARCFMGIFYTWLEVCSHKRTTYVCAFFGLKDIQWSSFRNPQTPPAVTVIIIASVVPVLKYCSMFFTPQTMSLVPVSFPAWIPHLH